MGMFQAKPSPSESHGGLCLRVFVRVLQIVLKEKENQWGFQIFFLYEHDLYNKSRPIIFLNRFPILWDPVLPLV